MVYELNYNRSFCRFENQSIMIFFNMHVQRYKIIIDLFCGFKIKHYTQILLQVWDQTDYTQYFIAIQNLTNNNNLVLHEPHFVQKDIITNIAKFICPSFYIYQTLSWISIFTTLPWYKIFFQMMQLKSQGKNLKSVKVKIQALQIIIHL